MAIITYGLIAVYAVLTSLAGIVELRNSGFKLQTFLFIIIGAVMLLSLFILNNGTLFILLMVCFIVLHLLAILMGFELNGKLTYSHHVIRFVIHLVFLFLVYKVKLQSVGAFALFPLIVS